MNSFFIVHNWLTRLVRAACGLDKPHLVPNHRDLDYLAGTWTCREGEGFRAATEYFERIDKDLWQ